MRDWFVNPYELAFCGHSGSGKTTIISRLTERLAKEFDIGYCKHDSHRFEMDHNGKDTFILRESGARYIRINDPRTEACIAPVSGGQTTTALLAADIVFIEGYKQLAVSKILVLARGESAARLIKKYNLTRVVAIINSVNTRQKPQAALPTFNRDDIDGIEEFVRDYFRKQAAATRISGAVLAGGRSERMGFDKATIKYHNATQLHHSVRLISGVFGGCSVSCRDEQRKLYPHLRNVEMVSDRFNGFGPLGAVATLLAVASGSARFVMACDMPFVTPATIGRLLKNRNPFKAGTFFGNQENGTIEPLCGIYEPKALYTLVEGFASGDYSLKRLLASTPVSMVPHSSGSELENINTPSRSRVAIAAIKAENRAIRRSGTLFDNRK